MLKKLALNAGIVAAASLALAPAALAAPPESETIVVDETFIDDETCDFPVSVHIEGRIRISDHFDQVGDLVFENQTPSFRITVTNPETGKSLRDGDVGLDKVTLTAEGGEFVLSTGIHFRILPERGAPIFIRVGLQFIIVAVDGSFEIQEVGGNFDSLDDFEAIACGYLADP